MKRVTVNDPDPSPRSYRANLGIGHPTIERGKIGVHIHPDSEAGKFLIDYQEQLFEHIGGHPSVVERQIINTAARLALHMELLDRRVFDGQDMNLWDIQHYAAWAAKLVKFLQLLGIKAAAKPKPNLLADILRTRPRSRVTVYDDDSDSDTR